MRIVVNKYNSETNKNGLELEVRLRDMSFSEWKGYYVACMEKFKKVAIEQSVTCIVDVNSGKQQRKESTYVKGKKTSEHYIEKTILESTTKDTCKYTLSRETSIAKDDFAASNIKGVRLRLRASFLTDEDWKIEITYVLHLDKSEIRTDFESCKNRIFPNMNITPDKFIEFVDGIRDKSQNDRARYEVEFEYAGTDTLDADVTRGRIDNYIHLINPDVGKQEQFKHIAEMFGNGTKSMKKFVSQPLALTKRRFETELVPNIDDYYLSDKADGERALLEIVCAESGVTKVTIWRADGNEDVTPSANKTDKQISKSGTYVLDVEVVYSGSTRKISKAYVFDILMVASKDVSMEPFSVREEMIQKACELLPYTEKKIQVRLSPDTYASQILEVYTRETRMYPIDGLIFTQDAPYMSMTVYKWKDVKDTTIDLLIVNAPKGLLGKPPYENQPGKDMYFLLCGISDRTFRNMNAKLFPNYEETMQDLGIEPRRDYFPVQFFTSDNPLIYIWYADKPNKSSGIELHGHVGEFRYHKGEWQLIKMRPDKDAYVKSGVQFGQDYRVADETFQQYNNPLTLEMMTDKTGASERDNVGYFAENKTEAFKPLTKFNSFVKAQLIRQLQNEEWVVDLASGKGQDLFVYSGFGVGNLVCVDQDQNALEELNRRKHELNNPKLYLYNRPPRNTPSIYTVQSDLNDGPGTVKKIHNIQSGLDIPISGIVMNFAIHYLLNDAAGLENVVNLVDSLLRPGGVFIFTCFDGARVFKLLRDVKPGQTWGDDKYSIRKDYSDDIFSGFGQKIGVVHPFSGGEHYVENLVDTQAVIHKFHERGYDVRQNASFANWFSKFRMFNPQMALAMDSSDITYCGLYQYVSLWKKIETKKSRKHGDRVERTQAN
jgi:SAM-dependent methyltransferase